MISRITEEEKKVAYEKKLINDLKNYLKFVLNSAGYKNVEVTNIRVWENDVNKFMVDVKYKTSKLALCNEIVRKDIECEHINGAWATSL